jgi:hypothetical protein
MSFILDDASIGMDSSLTEYNMYELPSGVSFRTEIRATLRSCTLRIDWRETRSDTLVWEILSSNADGCSGFENLAPKAK